MTSILEVKNLYKKYHTENSEIDALCDISFKVFKGDFISIVGSSGCGKSTLLHILANIEELSSGEIIKKDNIKLGYMLQQDALLPWLNILDNVTIGLRINKSLNKDIESDAIKMLTKYGLEEFIYSYPSNLSGGMRQRVALIRTLIMNPDIILLDEPFSALDYQTRLVLSNNIYDILKNESKTVVMITHDLAEAISMSSRIIVLSKRPGTIKSDITIVFSKDMTPVDRRNDNKFKDYYSLLCKELDLFV